MIITQDKIKELSKNLVLGIVTTAHLVGFTGESNISKYIEEKEFKFHVDFLDVEGNQHGSVFRINYDGNHLASIPLSDCRIFSRSDSTSVKESWLKEAKCNIEFRLTQIFVEKFLDTDLYISKWFSDLIAHMYASITISGIRFKTHLAFNTAWFQVESGDVIVYRIEKSNFLNMTTKQGWQNMTANNIKSELHRTIVTLLMQRDDFKLPLEL